MEKKQQQFSLWYFLATILLVMAMQDFLFGPHAENLAYNEFKALLKAGKLDDVVLTERVIMGTLKADGLEGLLPVEKIDKLRRTSEGRHQFVTVRLNDPSLIAELEAGGVRFTGIIESRWFATLLSWIIPALVFFALWGLIMKRMGTAGGVLEIGKSRAKVYMEKQTGVTFEDVAGVDEAKEELREIVEFLKQPQRYGRLGARIPKGVLLVGPPGTGKTLLARAVAGEAGVAFFSINGSEFVEMFVGVGAARVRDLFDQARKQAPAIIFIDELDALGRARGAFPGVGGHDEREQTLNQLLSEMDGFDTRAGLVLLAATNRPEILDPALLRAGRFDRQVLVDRPDRHGRIAILRVHLKKVQLAADADPDKIAALTPGFSGADLANLVNEAALLATRRGAEVVSMDDFTRAVERIVAGLEKRNRLLNKKEREVVAFHEMGHALVAISLPGTDPVHKISIIPRGIGALGYTIQRPTEDRYLMTSEELMNKMAVLLGGRAAEQLIFEHLSTGAADDLAKVTDIARGMVMRYGMHVPLGHVAYESERPLFLQVPGAPPPTRDYSEETAREIDHAVRDLVAAAFEKARTILHTHRETLERGARELLAKETLTEEDLNRLRPALSNQPVPLHDMR